METKRIRCQFRCVTVTRSVSKSQDPDLYGRTHDRVGLRPVTEGSRENREFFADTPAGVIELDLVLPDLFEPGKDYFVDFIRAEDVLMSRSSVGRSDEAVVTLAPAEGEPTYLVASISRRSEAPDPIEAPAAHSMIRVVAELLNAMDGRGYRLVLRWTTHTTSQDLRVVTEVLSLVFFRESKRGPFRETLPDTRG